MRRRSGGGREDGRFLEYLALGVLAAIILSGLVTTGLQARIGDGVASAVCHVVGGRHCGASANGKSAQAGTDGGHPSGDEHGRSHGKNSGGQDGKKDDGGCHGVFGCAWHYVKKYYGGFYSAAGDEAKGIWNHGVDMFHHPWDTTKATWAGLVAPWTNNFKRAWHRWQKGDHVKAAGLLFVENVTEPYVIAYHTVVDDGVRKDWKNGDYAHMAGRLAWNIGTWFLPGFDELKGASVGSKIAGGVERHAGEKAGEKAGTKAGKEAGKDAGKEHPGEGRDKGKRPSACGAPAAYSYDRRRDVTVVAADTGDAAARPAALPLLPAGLSNCDIKKAMRAAGKYGLPGGRKSGPFRFRPKRGEAPKKIKDEPPTYVDRFGNRWQQGAGHGRAAHEGYDKEWDVQLSKKGEHVWGKFAKTGKGGQKYVNVTPDGYLSH